jgi:hypothetical protein
MVWVCLTSAKKGVFQDKKKRDGAKHRQNTKEKPVSVCFTPDTVRGIPLSAEQ